MFVKFFVINRHQVFIGFCIVRFINRNCFQFLVLLFFPFVNGSCQFEWLSPIPTGNDLTSSWFFNPDTGIIVITERMAAGIRDEIDKFSFGRSFPLIIEIPDRTGPLAGRVSIRQMVRSAVGISV